MSQSDAPSFGDSALVVAQGTVALGLAAGAIGALIGVRRGKDPVTLGGRMAVNGGVAGLGYFAFREYLIAPGLAELRGRQSQELSGPSPWRHGLTESALAGGLTGGSMSALARGPRTIIPAAITSALLTASLQLTINAVKVARLEALTVREQRHVVAAEEVARQKGLSDEQQAEEQEAASSSFGSRLWTRLQSYSPIRKLSDEEYLDILHTQASELEQTLATPPSPKSSSSSSSSSNINVGDTIRQLDVVKRKIEQVQDKMRFKQQQKQEQEQEQEEAAAEQQAQMKRATI